MIKRNLFNRDYIVILISLLISFLIFSKTELMDYSHPHFKNIWDHHKYLRMAKNNPFDFHIAPFCWRVFVPTLAKILPFGIENNFKVISFLSIAFTGFFMFKIGQKIFSDTVYAFSMMFGYFSLVLATKYVLYDFWLPDAFSFLLIVSGIYAILIRNDLLFILITILGALTKEIVLFILPLHYSLTTNKIFDFKLIKRTILVSLPAVFTFVMIRILIPSLNENVAYVSSLPIEVTIVHLESSNYSYIDAFNQVIRYRIQNFSPGLIHQITLMPFLIYLLFPVFDLKSLLNWGLRFLPFVFLVYLQILFAINTDRLVVAAFPAILIVAILGLQNLINYLKLPKSFIIVLTIVYVLMNIFSGIYYSHWLYLRQIFVFLLMLIMYKSFGRIFIKLKDKKL